MLYFNSKVSVMLQKPILSNWLANKVFRVTERLKAYCLWALFALYGSMTVSPETGLLKAYLMLSYF